jgi:hypothetical protein
MACPVESPLPSSKEGGEATRLFLRLRPLRIRGLKITLGLVIVTPCLGPVGVRGAIFRWANKSKMPSCLSFTREGLSHCDPQVVSDCLADRSEGVQELSVEAQAAPRSRAGPSITGGPTRPAAPPRACRDWRRGRRRGEQSSSRDDWWSWWI